MLALIRSLPLLTFYVLFFCLPFKEAIIGYVSSCVIQLLLYKVIIGQFSFPHFFYFLNGLLFAGAALYFEEPIIFKYEISFLLLISAVYILYQSLRTPKGPGSFMGVFVPRDQKLGTLGTLSHLNNGMSLVYFVLGLSNIVIIQYLPEVYWVNFRVFGVYLVLMLVSGIIGFSLAKSDDNQKNTE